MSKGALPLPYVVAIIFAIIVIAVIVYMFLTQTGIFSITINEQYCDAQKLGYCYNWQTAGRNNPPEWDERCANIGVTAPDEPACEQLGIEIS
jgi:hypothetical protein